MAARAAFAASVCVAASVLFEAAAADACTLAAEAPALIGYPSEGAVGVPTDVRPIYDGERLSRALLPRDLTVYEPPEDQAPAFELVDDAGVVTPLSFGAGGGAWFVELVPPGPLSPRTHYTVRGIAEMTIGEPLQLSFTTGDGLAEPPGPLDAAIQHYTLKSDTATSCSPWPHGTCISFPAPSLESGVFVQGIHSWAGGMDSSAYLSRRPWMVDLAGINQGTPFDCIHLRKRAPNGALGAETIRCRQDGELHDIRGSEQIACTAGGITQDDRLVGSLPESEEPAPTLPSPELPVGVSAENGAQTQEVVSPGEGAAAATDSSSCSMVGARHVSVAPHLLIALLGLVPLRRGARRRAAPPPRSRLEARAVPVRPEPVLLAGR